ncbi:plexin-D1-like [Ruditapes philippinarum]|uniref:plexin-D1-like n=1 Tax=Ruditapes philippinarum TaxID=129788 RepID=UPI00295B3C8C|nr:plexin-D1-like [Ruditapes philippinarum]
MPKPRTEDVFKCRLVDANDVIIASDIHAERNDSEFTCAMPFISEHVELKIELHVQTTSNENILLSEATILFFECVKFKRCTDCINRSDSHCNWCNNAVMCQTRQSTCKSGLVNSKEFCPQLTDSRGVHYVHAGILTSVLFHGRHLQPPGSGNKYYYTCTMSDLASSKAMIVNNSSITCSVIVPQLSDKQLQNETIKVYYSFNQTRTSVLEDEYENYVTVYNCTMLARDCSHCLALNKSRFDCAWCTETNRCEHRDLTCSTTTCPAPTITDVVPRDGPVTGNTTITINGYDLGSDLSDINIVKVAEIPCIITDDISQLNVTDYGNFETRAPNRIICMTGSSLNETSGTVNISVNGHVSNSDVIFSYQVPIVTDIVPHYGPEAGGTRMTIYGENLGIGNRNVRVYLENKPCLRPEMSPKLPLGNVSPTNFTIICTVDNGYTSNITMVTITIDDVIVVAKEPVSFTFVGDPKLNPLSPKKAFFSGGTKITIEGKQLDNAHNARIELNYGQDLEIGDCTILSERLTTCKVPRAPEFLQDQLLKSENTTVKFSKFVRVVCVVYFDNVHENFEISYYLDPTINDLTGSGRVVEFEADDRRLEISGKMLNNVATLFDIQ